MHVKPHHPLMELLAQLLHGIETVPPKEQRRMANRACREATKWHKKEVENLQAELLYVRIAAGVDPDTPHNELIEKIKQKEKDNG